MSKYLFIHCRRGLFQLTICQNCKHQWQCENCSANLVSYRRKGNLLELLCHQCQSSYNYPSSCPKCRQTQIVSSYGGIDDLQELLEKEFELKVVRLDIKEQPEGDLIIGKENSSPIIYLSTRIFDPSIEYGDFEKIIFIQADNLLASPDYLVQEEMAKAICEVVIQAQKSNTEIIFDTKNPEDGFFKEIIKLNTDHPNKMTIEDWYKEFLAKESVIREMFRLPPFENLLLLTTQEKELVKAKAKLESVKLYLDSIRNVYGEITYGNPYQAKFLKRKNLFSYHLLIKFPRNYPKFFQFKQEIYKISQSNNLQVRLNPRHLF